MERWLWYFSEIVVCLPCLSIASLTSLHPLLIQHSWSSVNQSLPTMGRVEAIQHHAVWLKVPPKFPLSTAAVFQGPIRGLDSMLLMEKLHFLSAKSPVFPSQVWMSLVVQLMLRLRISIAYRAGISSPLVHTQGQREQNVKLFAIVYWKSANKVTLEWDRIRSALGFCQPPSKYVPWHECLLRK